MTPELVTLKGGATLPLDAVRLALDLEDRGIKLSVGGDGVLTASPRALLTAADIAAVRRHRESLKAIVVYCDRIEVA